MKKFKVLFLIELFICIVLFFSFVTGDVVVTTRNGISLWDIIFEGRIRDFYTLNEDIVLSSHWGTGTAYYNFPIYVIFAVWNIPNYLYEHFTGKFSLDTVLGLFWAKSICVPFILGVIHECFRILEKFAIKDKYEIVLFMLTSGFFFAPIILMGQYDIIPVYFMVKGLAYRMKSKMNAFCLMFAIASIIKPFALLAFIPIVLLGDKSFIRISISMIKAVSLLLCCKVIQHALFRNSGIVDGAVSNHFLSYIFEGEEALFYGAVSLFVFGYVVFLFYLYFFKRIEKKEDIFYYSICSFFIFFVTSLTHPQWIIYLLPFTTILLFTSQEKIVALILDTIMSVGVLVAQISRYYWLFVNTAVKYSFWGLLLNKKNRKEISVLELLYRIMSPDIGAYLTQIGGGIFIAGVVLFIIVRKHLNSKLYLDNALINHEEYIYIARMAGQLILGMLLISTCFL